MNSKLSPQALEMVSSIFQALSDPTRLQILQELKCREMNGKELLDQLDISQSTLSKQLRILHDAGVLEKKRDGNAIYYSIGNEMFLGLCQDVCGLVKQHLDKQSSVFS